MITRFVLKDAHVPAEVVETMERGFISAWMLISRMRPRAIR